MSLPVTIQLGNPDPLANPTNLQQLIDIIRELLTSELAGDFNFYVMSSATPAVDDQTKIWFKLDGAGRPLGTYKFYNGYWRRANTGLAQEYRYFRGNPATYFDGTGKGLVNTDWDGWALANGQNGTDNLSDKFIVIGKIDDSSGYNEATAKWESRVSGANANTGGVKDITLSDANTFQNARPVIKVGRHTADGNAPDATGPLYGSNLSAAEITLQAADAGNPTPPAIPTLPPYYSLAIAKWIGYT